MLDDKREVDAREVDYVPIEGVGATGYVVA
jgi:hypothetical protein